MGDDCVVVFPGAVEAVRWALTQVATAELDRPPAVGAETGDVEPDELEALGGAGAGGRPGDAPGPGDGVLGRARALARQAEPGQVLVGDVVRLLVRDVPELEVVALDGRSDGHVLRRRATSGLTVFPRQLAAAASHRFVPREPAWAGLVSAWQQASQGAHRAVFVEGEAGAGKTRLLTEFARHVAAQGAIVAYGGSTEEVETPFQPFIEALEPVVDRLELRGLGELVSTSTLADLARLLPNLGRGGGPPAAPSPLGPEADRHWAFEAAVDLLGGLGRRAPVLLLLDDVHWAGRPTIGLLEHLVRSGRLARVCLVVAFRSAPGDRTDAFGEALPELVRRPGVERLTLGAFGAAAIGGFVAAATSGDAHPVDHDRLVAHLAERTGGNAFLLTESWQHLLETRQIRREDRTWIVEPLDAAVSPRSVREAIDHRLARLPASCRLLLELGACVGESFDVRLVALAASQSVDVTLDLLGQAVLSGLVAEEADGRFAYAHALVRQSIEEALPAGTRRRRHLSIAEALSGLAGGTNAQLAYHYGKAVPLVAPSAAVSYARAAADELRRGVAYEEAAGVLRAALALTDDAAERAELLIDLGGAHAVGGASEEATDACREAAALGRRLGRPDVLVRAALVMAEATWRGAANGAPAVPLLEEALEVAEDEPVRCRLLAGLSAALAFSGRAADSSAAGEAAVAMARSQGDPRLLADAIHNCLYRVPTPLEVDRQLELATEGISAAERVGDDDRRLRLTAKANLRLLVRADPPRLRHELEVEARLAEQLRQPYYLLVAAGNAALVALADGRLADAEAAVDRYQHWVEVNRHPGAGYGIQMFSIRREQGRLPELRPYLELGARLQRDDDSWVPGLAALYAEAGLAAEARGLLDRLAAADFEAVADDSLLPAVLSYLADAADTTGHEPTAAAVLRRLSPYAGLLVLAPGLVCYGAADRYLGKACDVLGQTAAARRHLEAALALDERTGWETWIAHSRFALGRHLLLRGRRPERARGLALLEAAGEAARRIGMATLAGRCADVVGSMDHLDATRGANLTDKEAAVLRLVAQGLSNREIGERLLSSPHTVANHIRAILLKTGCSNRTEAAAWAHRTGLVGDRASR